MKKNITWKILLIVGTLLIFLWGIFLGTDPAASIQAIKEKGLIAGIQQNIHLGLDLKGGTHLILQVKVNDAVKSDSQQVAERLKDYLRNANINYTDVTIEDSENHPELISLKGIAPESTGDLRNIVTERLSDYNLTSGANNTFTLTMKPQTPHGSSR